MREPTSRETGGAGAWSGIAFVLLLAGVGIYAAAHYLTYSFEHWCK